KGEVRNIPVESALGQTVGSLDANRKLENEPFQKSCTSTSQSPENRITKSIYMKLNVKTIERLKKNKGDRDWDALSHMRSCIISRASRSIQHTPQTL
ncbi:MAG: hypothetical protein Q8P68_01400, partial [Candidatus Peregrinibacteria bacterium]|nr:hypothetical protein [Candidatus Peregrinibacteria bacterium]MDZ4245235.1 hypothetical protein [Candidatus Gracilibacteria bacterium]